MSRIFLLLLPLFVALLPERETKKITVDHLFPPIREVYYVLKSDSAIRHGSYRLTSGGKILVEGFYREGRKDSLWIQRNDKGKLRFTGSFINDHRTGIWAFYDNSGELEQKLDFSNNEVLYYRTQFYEYPFKIISPPDTLVSVLDRPPLFLGGSTRLKEYIAEEITIPLHKSGEVTKGTVYVELVIDSTGRIANQRLLKGIGKVCNQEALRVAKSLPMEWMPGIYKGRNVAVVYILPIRFDVETKLK